MRARSAGPRWLSFHLFLPGDFDIFLFRYFRPTVWTEIERGRVRRFFYIRYSEGGEHLRLRILPSANADRSVEDWLESAIEAFCNGTATQPELCVLSRASYDRTEMYFGETLASVYSELLNEQTSWVAFQLMEQCFQNRQRLVLMIASLLDVLFAYSAQGMEAKAAALGESRAFALETLRRYNWTPAPISPEAAAAFESALHRVLPALRPTFSADQIVRRTVRLLRRARRASPQGRFAATHALHLLCGKVGISLAEEYRIYAAMGVLAGRTGGEGA